MYRTLSIDEEETLKFLYVRQNIPTDQYKRRPEELRKLTDGFNALTERSDEPDALLHFMVNRRKAGKWPKLGVGYKRLACVPLDMLPPDEWKTLEQIYLDINKGSDNYAYDAGLRKDLAQRFAASAVHFVPARTLCAALEMRRKKGLLPKLTDQPPKPFADMDSVAL
jgi:hypothetical protein